MKRVLYINACVREKDSRTDRLARALLSRLDGTVIERDLAREDRAPLSNAALASRTRLCAEGKYDDPSFSDAREFASADEIVISAPLWDLSFPAVLKVYLENVYVIGIVSRYGADGVPVGLCRAKRIFYVSTSGGPFDPRYSYGYVADLATHCFGIPEARLVYAEGLDLWGADPEAILTDAVSALDNGI